MVSLVTMIDSFTVAANFHSGAGVSLSPPFRHNRHLCCSNAAAAAAGAHVTSCRFSHSATAFGTARSRFPGRTSEHYTTRNNLVKYHIQAVGKALGSGSEHTNQNEKSTYHPSEDIAESTSQEIGDARLSEAEISRTIVEVNSKATLMFSGMIEGEVHDNLFWPELPYIKDEYGNIYFQVNNDEDIMQGLAAENNYVQVIVGLDTVGMIKEMELSGPSVIDFDIDEIEGEDSDFEDENVDEDEDNVDDSDENEDYDKDWVAIMEDDEDENSDENVGDWAKLETMRSSHPMYFAKTLAEVAAGDPVDWMNQLPAGIAIQGLLRPALIEEQSVIIKHISEDQSSKVADINGIRTSVNGEDIQFINDNEDEPGTSNDGSTSSDELEKDDIQKNGTTFYRLEMVKIQLLSENGSQTFVEVEDYSKARADAIAHSAAKIISRLKDGGEKTTQALKSLCWRNKGIHVEEATLIAIDTLGFDLRVCSGTQVQTLRFAYHTRATSEYGAERQLNDLLFPGIQQKGQKSKQPHQKEC